MSASAAPMSEPAVAPSTGITDAEFALLRDVIYRSSGIFLGENKQALLVSRLSKRLRDLRLDSFSAYYEYLLAGRDPVERERLLECIVTNETRFFREPSQFEFLEVEVCAEWKRQASEGRRSRHVRVWSAACSTGEEAYSLAMSLLWHLPREDGWSVEVLGTDLSGSVLEVARSGTWSAEQARHIPHRYLVRFMRRGTRDQEGRMSAGAEVRSVVRFGRVNLGDEADYPNALDFDLILCRNVLIYFDQNSRDATLQQLSRRLASGGYLFLGHAERPGRALQGLDRVGPTLYRASDIGFERRPA